MTVRKSTDIPPPPQWLFLAIMVAFIFLSASTCHAGWRPRIEQERMLPPEQFRYYWGDYEIRRLGIDQITMICKNSLKQPDKTKAVACSMRRQGKCIILISNDDDLEIAGWDYDIVL